MTAPVLHYFTASRHSSTLHRASPHDTVGTYMACTGRQAQGHRVYQLSWDEAHSAYSSGAKVCQRCFPDGLPNLVDEEAAKEPPVLRMRQINDIFRPGELNVVVARPSGGKSILGNVAQWIGDEAVAGRFYRTMDSALEAYAKKLAEKG